MNRKMEDRIQRKIRKRAFAHLDRLEQRRRISAASQHTLEALAQVTGLPQPELQAITREVNLSLGMEKEAFFSIKNQILLVLGVCALVVIFGGLLFVM